MADEVRTTQYLFEFATAGDEAAAERFQKVIAQLDAFEKQLEAKMANIDRLLKGGGGAAPSVAMPPILNTQDLQQAQQSLQQTQQVLQQTQQVASQGITVPPMTGGEKLLYVAQAQKDGVEVMTEYRKRLDDTVGTVERSRSTFNAYGTEIEKLTESTWKGADGVQYLKRSITTDVTPGVAQIKSFSQEVDQGAVRIQTMERALNDQGQTVIRTKEAFDLAGNSVEKFTTTSWTAADGLRQARTEHERFATNIPQRLSTFEEKRDGKVRVTEMTEALNDLDKTVVRTKESFDAGGTSLGKYTTTTKTLADGTKETKVAIEGLNEKMRGGATYTQQFARHLTWISQGIILWAGIGAVSDAIRGWWVVQRELNQALAEFEMRTQATPGQLEQFRQGIMDVSQETGVSPTKLAQVAPVAPDEATLRYAAELQRVAGGDMQNQMQWLIAAQRQFGMEGENTVQILDAMASGWRVTNLPMSEFLTMLRNIAPLSHGFNMSMREMYSFMGALQAATGAEGKELELLMRNMVRLYEPDVATTLGIQTTQLLPSGEIEQKNLIAILDEVNQKIKDGDITLQQFSELLGAVGRGQRQQAESMMLGWDALIQSMAGSMDTPAQWATFFGIAMDTSIAKADALKSSWERLLSTIGDTKVITDSMGRLAHDMDELRRFLEGDISFGEMMTGGVSYKKEQARLAMETALPVSTYGQRAAAGDWPTYAGQMPTAPYRPDSTEFTYPQQLGSWPSQTMIPEGVDFSDVIQSMDQWVAAFSALGPEFANWVNANMEAVMVYDENTHNLQVMNVFLPALQRAISENTQAQKARELQPGMRNVDMDLSAQGGMLMQWVRYYTEFLNRMGMPQEQRPQLVLGINDTFLRLWASNEALMLAIRSLTDATEDQTDVLSGMWNVPEGATMWVPIQSLFYSRQPGGDTGGGPILPPPSTLPAQQPDWMGLPGAVDNMTVGTMTVTNMEGLTFPVSGDDESTATSLNAMIEAWREGHGGFGWPASEQPMSIEPPWVAPLNAALMNYQTSLALSIYRGPQIEPPPMSTEPAISSSISLDTLQIDTVTVPTLEVAASQADVMSMMVRQTSMSTDIMTPMTDIVAGTANIIATSLTGLPSPDMTGVEGELQVMTVTLQLILATLQGLQPIVFPPGYTPTVAPFTGGGGPTPDQARRFNQESSFWNFTNYSRMRSSF